MPLLMHSHIGNPVSNMWETMTAKLWAVRRIMKLLNPQGCLFPCGRGNEKEQTMIVEVHGTGFWTRVRFPPGPLASWKQIFIWCSRSKRFIRWKHSSAGRALAWLAGGHGFEPRCFHCGVLAQLGARHIRIVEATGSNPVYSSKKQDLDLIHDSAFSHL